MNKVFLVGCLRDVPQLKEVRNIPLIEFSLGCKVPGKDKEMIWYNCAGWGEKYVKMADQMHKSQKVIVAGELQAAKVLTSKKTGNPFSVLNVKVESIDLIDAAQPAASAPAAPTQSPQGFDEPDEDLPF